MAATWPGKDSELKPVGNKFPQWRVKIWTRMPAPCNKKLWCQDINVDGRKAGQRARSVLDQMVRRHIDGCAECKANGVNRP